jgi:hypothetical protein
VVAFQTAASSTVSYVTVDTAAAAGAPVAVSSGGEPTAPDVAMIPDGRFAVVWQSGSNIFVQRYDAGGVAVAGDQDNPINISSPPASDPAIAATADEGGFYVVAWTADDGTIWSRVLDGAGGFRVNSVTGQNGDHLASHPGIAGPRSAPDVAIGGGGFIAIGWSNDGGAETGIHVRRFPYPSAFE